MSTSRPFGPRPISNILLLHKGILKPARRACILVQFVKRKREEQKVGVAATDGARVTTVEPHRLVVGNVVLISKTQYAVMATESTTTLTLDREPPGNSSLLTYETLNLHPDAFHHYGVALPPIASQMIVRRRRIRYDFNNDVPSLREGSTGVDGSTFYADYRITAHVGLVEEWLVQNMTDVVHMFHAHVNPHQVCGFRDGNFGFNKTYVDRSGRAIALSNSLDYSFDVETDVPFEGYEDTTSMPPGNVALAKPGELRLRMRFADYTGIFYTHCHLLDDQDCGMMKPVEIVGHGYTPAPLISSLLALRGTTNTYKTDFQNNVEACSANSCCGEASSVVGGIKFRQSLPHRSI